MSTQPSSQTPSLSTLNALASRLKSLHKPGHPLLLTNIWSPDTASALLTTSPPPTALATASYAIAATHALPDAALPWSANLSAIAAIAPIAHAAGIPLTADAQDGYDDVAQTIRDLVGAGVVGCNIEDLDNRTERVRGFEDAVGRVRLAVRTAREECGVRDFVVNARTDVLYDAGFDGGEAAVAEAVRRGKAFLEAGATTVFVWGGPNKRGVSKDEIRTLVDAFGGMLNVKMNLAPGFLNAKEIAELGVARISIGPGLYNKVMASFNQELQAILQV